MGENQETQSHSSSPAEVFDAGASFESNEDTAAYTVIREKVKKRPVNTRKLLRNAAGITVGAVLFGIIAAFVFTRFSTFFVSREDLIVPVEIGTDPVPTPTESAEADTEEAESVSSGPEGSAEEGSGPASAGENESGEAEPESEASGEEPSEETDGTEEDGQDVSEETGAEDGGTEADGTGEEEPAEEPDAEKKPVTEPERKPTPEEESAARIEQNRLLYSDLQKISARQKNALVTVTGISGTEEWFEAELGNRRETSGLIVASNGRGYLILTDVPAVDTAENLYVTFYDGTICPCAFVKSDPVTGLGILEAKTEDIGEETLAKLTIASLGNSYYVRQGDPVIAIGKPAGNEDSVVFGQVTSMSGSVSLMDAEYTLMTTNMQRASGSSGAILNMSGEIVGLIM